MNDKERIEILKYAKAIVSKGDWNCICPAINNAFHHHLDMAYLEEVPGFRRTSRIFPELRKYKPKGAIWGERWFNEDTILKDRNVRIRILNSMIKEIKAKL